MIEARNQVLGPEMPAGEGEGEKLIWLIRTVAESHLDETHRLYEVPADTAIERALYDQCNDMLATGL